MKKFCLPLIAVAIVAVMIVVALFHKNAQPVSPQISTYLHKVYPLADKKNFNRKFFDGLDFYWYDPATTAPFFKSVATKITAATHSLFVCLSWMNACVPKGPLNGVVRDRYREGVKSPSLAGVGNNHLIEVYHNGWYQEPGLYFYALKGTGTFLNVGKTLVARNKVDAFHKLGASDSDILKVVTYYENKTPADNTFDFIATYADDHKINFDKALHTIMAQSGKGSPYIPDRFNATASTDYALYHLAREKGYATLQFTNQANTSGGWGFEIVDLRANNNDSLTQRWLKERKYLFVADPFHPKHREACQQPVPFKMVRCTQVGS